MSEKLEIFQKIQIMDLAVRVRESDGQSVIKIYERMVEAITRETQP